MAGLIEAAPRDWTSLVLVSTLGYYTAAAVATLDNVRTSLWVMGSVYAAPLLPLSVLALWLAARPLVRLRPQGNRRRLKSTVQRTPALSGAGPRAKPAA